MNRNFLKLIACITMFIDHVGMILYPDILILRIIGRLAFPIFCFFVAEGLHYTKDYKTYLLRLLIFAIISQVPYYFVRGVIYKLNIIFLFIIATIIIKTIDNLKRSKLKMSILLLLSILIAVLTDWFNVVDYGLFGIILIMLFYYFRDNKIKYLLSSLLIFVYRGAFIIIYGPTPFRYAQLFAIFSLIFIYFYNNKKGKLNLKYFFYWFYPLHLSILVLLKYLFFQ